MADLSGELIDGRYRLNRIIASGGMATIYSALDQRLDRQVAVKIMHPHLAQEEKFVERFIREAKAAAALSHPNIVSVLDQGWNQGGVPCVFIVMELIEGSTLRDFLNEQGSLPIDRTIQLLIPVASALAAAHRIGIVHRDIKPENILVSKEGRIKIADFGLARGALLGSTMTAESSAILGSVSYLSPEQVQRGIADSRSDIYSLGIVLFELLTGEKPYKGEDPVQIAIRHVNDRIPAPSTLKPSISADLDQLVLRATDVDPDRRPRDGSAFLEELRTLSEKFDPRKRQLSLELDLPPAALKTKTRRKESPNDRRDRDKSIEQTPDTMARTKEVEMGKGGASEATTRVKRKKVSARVRRNRRIASLIALSLFIATWYLIAGPAAKVVVPSLAGMSIKSAKAELRGSGLTLVISSREFSEDIPEGRVISSNPAGGGRISPDGEVAVTVSKGKERYLVPQLIGLKVDVAQGLLEQNKLVLGEISEEFSSDYAAGLIISSDPKSGERVMRDSVISLVISKGVEQVAISDYSGNSGEQALNELVDAGFKVKTKYVFSEDLPAGAVVSQDPLASAAGKGSLITLLVSKGSEFAFVPNVITFAENKAIATIEDLDLTVKVNRVGTKKGKVVTNISPKVGTKLKRGSTVTLTVG